MLKELLEFKKNQEANQNNIKVLSPNKVIIRVFCDEI